MTFLNPLLLLGLAAAAIPLIIHLFNFRRPKRISFSSLAFLNELKKSTMQRVRVKQWLLLALRTLAIAALAFSFARPTLDGSLAGLIGAGGRTTAALVLDHSTSMTLRDGSGAYLDQVKSIATELLADFESGDELILVPHPSTGASGDAYQNAGAAIDAINGLEPQEGSDPLTKSIQRAANLLADKANLNRVLYVLSDFQTSSLSDSSALSIPDDVRLVLLPVGTDGRGNLSVSEISVLSQIVASGQPVRIEARFTNFGSEDALGVVSSVFLGDVRVGQANLDIPAGSSATAQFVVTPRETGWLAGRVELDDNQFLYDNARNFTLLVPAVRNVLVVNGRNAPSRYVQLGLSSALVPDAVRFETTEISETGLAAASLGQYDSVILNGVTTFSSGEQSALKSYVQGGGGVLIFPADGIQISDYNELLAELEGGRIASLPESSTDGLTVGVFEQVDTDHPLFEGMFEPDPSGKTPQLEQPVIYKALTYAPGSATEQSVIGLSGGVPFLQEIRSGQGSVLLFAVEAGIRWSDFAVRGLFLPMLYRSLYYLSATGSVSGEGFPVEGSLQLRLAGVDGNQTIVVVDETGEEFIPDQRTVQGAKVADLSGPFFIPGIYSVEVDGEVMRRVVVHPSEKESNLVLMNPEDATTELSKLGAASVSVLNLSLTGTERLDDQLKEARTGIELWNVFLGLALIFLVLEMIVSKLWKPESAH